MANSRSFFTALFDFSFSEFITPRVVGVLYGIAIFFVGLGALSFIAASFRGGFLPGIFTLLVAPLASLLYIILIRVGLEGLMVAFRTAANTGRTADNTESLRNP
ncbi:DUF4282 domain-containing protein [Nostoc sp. CENA67]|uniref:DUF4282 domain-containing protein n=1 Tax=Amazonocrinis nigriterrae CENA67 TaxID=2794033 RepID=A0A8J7L7R5_9NOST|nr:DUF4282 domain-containing protein [Amazonocrinis nigriterrae]MBH8562583.1 DUF4282 domain-containing protein [Amazonocrinis nigriterrae CENA67]BAZ48550.1 hypothetical protein NIES4103_11580 [Nostoc sp. NIES-4103]